MGNVVQLPSRCGVALRLLRSHGRHSESTSGMSFMLLVVKMIVYRLIETRGPACGIHDRRRHDFFFRGQAWRY